MLRRSIRRSSGRKKRTNFEKNKDNKGVEKKGRKGGKALQASTAEVDSHNDGEYENSDSKEEENSNASESERRRKRRSENVSLQSREAVKGYEGCLKLWLTLKHLTL